MKTNKEFDILNQLLMALKPYDYDSQKTIAEKLKVRLYEVGRVAMCNSKQIDEAIEQRKNKAERDGDPFIDHMMELVKMEDEKPSAIGFCEVQHYFEMRRLNDATKVADKAKELNGDADTDFNDLARRYEAMNRDILMVEQMTNCQ